MIGLLWAEFKKNWPPNRVVTLLTPLVFVPVAGSVAAWLAENFPGLPPMDSGWLAGIFIAGALAAVTAAYKWLDGWQAYEKQIADPNQKPILAPGHQDPPPVKKEDGEPLPPDGDQYEFGGQFEGGLDDDALLSEPADIAESDADPPEMDERVEREELTRPQ